MLLSNITFLIFARASPPINQTIVEPNKLYTLQTEVAAIETSVVCEYVMCTCDDLTTQNQLEWSFGGQKNSLRRGFALDPAWEG